MYQAPDGNWYAGTADYNRMVLRTRMIRENWTIIPGFTRYAISTQGEIVNRARLTLLTPQLKNGRASISLVRDDGKQTTVSLGRLVAEAYLAPPEVSDMYYDIGYVDGNPENNNAHNLYWVPRWKNHANPDNYGVDIG